jgi:hypothetical protein
VTATVEMPTEQPARGGALVRIVDTPANIVEAWKEFENLKLQILTEADLQPYTVGTGANKQTKKFIKKSGWRKIATAFGISIERINVNTQHLGEDHIAITHAVRAVAPGGRSCDGVGSCDSHEERFEETTGKYKWKYNDVDGTAYTRAANRAISDLVGGGEVSAEEMSGVKDVTPVVPELPQKLQDRLAQIASYQGEEGTAKLARLIFDEIGSRFLTVEQATRVAEKLKAGPSAKAPEAANQKAEQATAKFEDAVVTEIPPAEEADEEF